jgi:hypothetical protein
VRRSRGAWQFVFGLALCSTSCRPGASTLHGMGNLDMSEELAVVFGKAIELARAVGASQPRFGMTGAGVPGDSLGGLVNLPPEACALILARGAANVQDLDVFAFADDGNVLASDESSAKDGSVLLCPPHPDRVFVSGRMAAGFGLFGVSVQTLPVALASVFEERFHTTPDTAREVGELDSDWPGLEERLTLHRRRLPGAWESLRKLALPLDPRAYASVSVSVEADRCIDLLMTPSDEVAQLDLEVLEANGRWIGSAEAQGSDRTLLVCSPLTRELTVRCRPHVGRGFGALVISRSESGAARQGMQHAARFDLRPAGPLTELRQAHAERLERMGYGPARVVQEGELPGERRISLAVPLARGCSRVDVITAAPVASIAAWLWDSGGNLIGDDARGSTATLFACGPETRGRLDLETLARGGNFSVEVRHNPAFPEVAGPYRLAMNRLLGLLDRRGLLQSLSRVPDVQLSRVSATELARFTLPLSAGHCLEVGAALDRGTSGLEVRLFEDGVTPGSVPFDDAGLGYGANAASAHICAVKPARDRIVSAELRANVGQGVVLWVSQTSEPDLRGTGARPR